jgi:VanZ family protein
MKSQFRFAIFWTIFTIVLSALSQKSTSKLVPFNLLGIDKLGHTFFYAVMVFLWIRAYTKTGNNKNTTYLSCVVVCNLVGIIMEWYQKTFTDRFFEYDDMIANFVGSIFGYLCFMMIKKYKNSWI